jgi:hypothetical protein
MSFIAELMQSHIGTGGCRACVNVDAGRNGWQTVARARTKTVAKPEGKK